MWPISKQLLSPDRVARMGKEIEEVLASLGELWDSCTLNPAALVNGFVGCRDSGWGDAICAVPAVPVRAQVKGAKALAPMRR